MAAPNCRPRQPNEVHYLRITWPQSLFQKNSLTAAVCIECLFAQTIAQRITQLLEVDVSIQAKCSVTMTCSHRSNTSFSPSSFTILLLSNATRFILISYVAVVLTCAVKIAAVQFLQTRGLMRTVGRGLYYGANGSGKISTKSTMELDLFKVDVGITSDRLIHTFVNLFEVEPEDEANFVTFEEFRKTLLASSEPQLPPTSPTPSSDTSSAEKLCPGVGVHETVCSTTTNRSTCVVLDDKPTTTHSSAESSSEEDVDSCNDEDDLEILSATESETSSENEETFSDCVVERVAPAFGYDQFVIPNPLFHSTNPGSVASLMNKSDVTPVMSQVANPIFSGFNVKWPRLSLVTPVYTRASSDN